MAGGGEAPAAKPQQRSTLRPWLFDITAGLLLHAARLPRMIPVAAWAGPRTPAAGGTRSPR
jgi:hypothetical protein